MIINTIQMHVKKDGGNFHLANVTTDTVETMDITIFTKSENPTQSAIAKACVYEIDSIYHNRRVLAKEKYDKAQAKARAEKFEALDAKDDPGPKEAESLIKPASTVDTDVDADGKTKMQLAEEAMGDAPATDEVEGEDVSDLTPDSASNDGMDDLDKELADLDKPVASEKVYDSGMTTELQKPTMKNSHKEMDAFIVKYKVEGVNPGDTKLDKIQKISLHFGGVV